MSPFESLFMVIKCLFSYCENKFKPFRNLSFSPESEQKYQYKNDFRYQNADG